MFDQTNPSCTDSLASASSRSLGNVTVPLALLLDERLTPLERNAWMVFHARVDGDGTSALPNYEQMRPFLACKAGNQRAAYETASRTVCVLRMTRWVHLVGHRRDPLTGQVQNTLYAVHDTPQSCQEVCASDRDYIELLERSVEHPNQVVRSVAVSVLNELAADQDLPASLRAQIALARARSGLGNDDSPGGPPSLPKENAPLPIPHDDATSTTSKADSPVRTYKYSLKEVRTYRAGAHEGNSSESASLRLPSCLARMAPDQHRDVQAALRRLPSEHQQAVLDELEARVQLGAVRNAVAYLFGLVKRVLAGEFRLWVAKKPTSADSVNAPPSRRLQQHRPLRLRPSTSPLRPR
ncbi:STY4528 family pathogenicity island replication protein [Pseudomonas aeruginosa]|uniref:STY4528 family pathogenicity island replication protein n=1 Tax=Pseudomonas aeruginosa TaxID=287 RepID=UPI000ADD339B|nr:STY4528 family pathogenicity island replication protein [Pseudomonas aeruginosa]NNB77647.1 hypothetical protein [Pseudomonas aeruginosa]RUB35994.1 hypothetical protein IPC1432_11570 [Pseudomonas aeruginosa]HCD6628665.1 hypothetical protein [Pseudomonas aeruginosa]HCD7565517.1 hypothetical protein [Pseudomonas aeruginosa]HCZ9132274.1 hypothetical protein [Pseudomonas aeruginosa]